MRREDDAMDTGRFGAAQERADILGILERVEDEDEWRLGALDATGKDLVERRESPRPDDEGDPLVPVEASDRCERSALDLDDRDPQVGRVENEPFEGLPTLRNDEQADGRTTGDECLLDGPASGHELLARVDQADRRRRRSVILGCPRSVRAVAAGRPGSGRATERSRRAIEWTGRAILGAAGRVVWSIAIRSIAIRSIRLVPEVRPPGTVGTVGPVAELGTRPARPVRRATAVA